MCRNFKYLPYKKNLKKCKREKMKINQKQKREDKIF